MSKDYKDTLNLPQTSFSMKAGLDRKEPEYLRRWEETGLYSLIREARKGKRYTLHDGPPYPTGDLHIGTGMNKILKDFIVRFRNMRGYDAPFIPGWDCHGLPIEHKVMTELGEEAEKLSDTEIRKRCLNFANKYVEANKGQFKSLGCLGDWDKPYLTTNKKYEAAVLKVFRRLVDREYVYRQLKPIHWCFSCRTALAEAELEYKERSDPSIYVEFPVVSRPSVYDSSWPPGEFSILVWTTTPWTLPANRGVAVHPEFDYVLADFRFKEFPEGRRLIVAADTLDRLTEEFEIQKPEVRHKFKGKSLEDLYYKQPWFEKNCPIIKADYVNLEEGTGCVHTAPGHGQEDYLYTRRHGLDVFSPVDEKGAFTSEVEDLAGKNVFEANEEIVKKLEAEGILRGRKEITHSYPHCWRCHGPVIFRATQQWFVSLQAHELREKALETVEKVKWIPDWGKLRIRGMLEQRPDWCISRQRKWGVPIPVFYCEKCNWSLLDVKVIDRIIELFAEKGADCWFSMKAIELLPEGTVCRNPSCKSTTFRKENDIFDVWFESGSSHWAVVIENDELAFPADLYLEGSDQHRGWFQLSLLLSLAAQDEAPFKSVLTHGFVVDQYGVKMSKSQGNFISVEGALKRFPADILRLWFSSIDYRRDINVSLDLIKKTSDSYRKIRNTVKHCLSNLSDFDPQADKVPYGEMEEIDRWALREVEQLRRRVTGAYEEFEFHKVYREIHNFCVVRMSSFYLDVIKDRLYTFAPAGRARRSGQTALREITVVLAQLLAPILCFTAEEVWGHLYPGLDAKESIHLSLWPEERADWEDEELGEKWEKLLEFRGEVLKHLEVFRNSGEIGNPLEAKVIVGTADPAWEKLLKEYEGLLPTILNVSQVEVGAPGAGEATGIEGVRVGLSRAEGTKCVRCWIYSPTVGKTPEDPTICRKCVEQIKDSKQ